jgi:hypothetical protein
MSTQTNPPHYRGEQPANPRDRVERRLPQHHQGAAWPSSDKPLPEFLNGARRRADRPITPPPAPQLPDTPLETAQESSIAPQEVPGLSPYELQVLEREIMRTQVRPRRSLAPELMPPPPPPPARPQARIVSGDSMSGLVMRLSLIVTVVVLGLLIFAGKISVPASWKANALEPLKRLGSLVSNSPQTSPAPPIQPTIPEAPRLVIEAADAGTEDEIGLGVKVQGPIEGVMAIVSGIAAGTSLSRGRPWGETGWFVPAAELGMTKLRPPAGFSGTMQYTVSLKMPDAKIADRQTLRLQWSDAQNGKDSAGLRKLEADEIATLLKRGQALFETGDLAGARLLLQRAAEAGDPVAAMAIASTYDPVVLQDLGVRGFVADVGKARYWYEKAREFGSKEAPRRLESLASQGR